MTSGARSTWIGSLIRLLYHHTTEMKKMEQMIKHLIATIGGLEAMTHNHQKQIPT
jgi:hypothetical protein